MKSNLIVQRIILELSGRAGFDEFWYSIDQDIREEILSVLVNIVDNELSMWTGVNDR